MKQSEGEIFIYLSDVERIEAKSEGEGEFCVPVGKCRTQDFLQRSLAPVVQEIGEEGCQQTKHDASGQIYKIYGIVAVMQKRHALVAECGERGETATEACGEEQACLGREVPLLGILIEQSDEEATQDVDDERGPGEKDAFITRVERHVPPHHAGEEAQGAACASSQKYEQQFLHLSLRYDPERFV